MNSYYRSRITKLQHALKYKGSTMTGAEREAIRRRIAAFKAYDKLTSVDSSDLLRVAREFKIRL